MGKVPKVILMTQCKVDGIWKKLPAPMSANGRQQEVNKAIIALLKAMVEQHREEKP
jgi:hypothetical protein